MPTMANKKRKRVLPEVVSEDDKPPGGGSGETEGDKAVTESSELEGKKRSKSQETETEDEELER